MSYIKRKEKKCKGTGKAKGNGCGKHEFIYKYGLCYECYQDWWHNSDEAKEIRKSTFLRSRKNAKPKKQLKPKSKTLPQLIQATRYPFQKLIRYRDYGKGCICCGEGLGNISDYDAGHFVPANICSQLIFHPLNVHGQLKECNQHKNGNYIGYLEGIKDRITADQFNELIRIKNKYSTYKWERGQLNRMKQHYEQQLRLVESGQIEVSDIDFSVGIIN